jgi:hypothetical protein
VSYGNLNIFRFSFWGCLCLCENLQMVYWLGISTIRFEWHFHKISAFIRPLAGLLVNPTTYTWDFTHEGGENHWMGSKGLTLESHFWVSSRVLELGSLWSCYSFLRILTFTFQKLEGSVFLLEKSHFGLNFVLWIPLVLGHCECHIRTHAFVSC